MKVKCPRCSAEMEIGPPPDFNPVKWAIKCPAQFPTLGDEDFAEIPSCVTMDDAITSAIIKAQHGDEDG